MFFLKFRFLVRFGIGLLLAFPCLASVKWEATELKFETALGAPKHEFAFAFKNEGGLPVEFDSPSATCGCTLTKLDKVVYLPGESGVLKGTYSTSGRYGLNVVAIKVNGNEVDGEVRRPFADTLKLIVSVPQVVTITPGITLWRKDVEPSTKTIRFEVNPAYPLPLKLANVSNEAFSTEWLEIEAGQVYELVVAPTSTLEAQRAVVTVEGANADGKIMRFRAHLIIR
jgi:hypothetical protein